MLDIRFVREHPDEVKENIKKKFQDAKLPLVDEVINLDAEYRAAIGEGDTLRANRNKLSKQIGMLMGQAKKDPSKAAEAEEIKKQVTAQADRLKELETKEAELQDKIRDIMYTIPQMIDPSVPIGPDDSCNVEVQRFGDPVVPDYPIPYHVDIMESFDGIDLDAAGRVSGNGFYYLLGDIARLHEAVLAYARDFMIDKGFTYVIPPFMMHGDVVKGVMSFPEMDAMMYKIEGEDLYLIGTSEHTMIGRFIDQTLDGAKLPLTLTSYSPCFRKENRSMADVYAGNLTYDYVLGVYDFMERLTSRYPDLLLEGCSGGGGRFDAGMLYYSPQIWCSDNTDAINRTRIQYGTSFFYPVSAVGAHVSAVPNHQTGRVTNLNTRGVTAMAGTFGYELNPALLSEEEKQTIREQIQTYKKYERLINEGTYWRLSNPFEDEVSAWMSVSREQDRALVSVVRLVSEANPATVYIRLRGLKPDAVYLEENSGKQYFGAALMAAGIPLPAFTYEYEAYQFSFVELKEAKKLLDKVQQLHTSGDERVVISIYGGSGSGKTTIATALQQYFLSEGIGCYLLGGDNYPHRIPKRNDEERLRVYEEAGEEGLREYLGTPKEIDFDCINQVLAEFHAGKDTITLRHMGREDGDISSEETDFTGVSVMLVEWTHGGSEYLKGVDIPVFLESSPEETKERRIRRNRDENAASPFICRVVELEQEKLDIQKGHARLPPPPPVSW